MPVLKRGLFSAALEYARMTGVIVNRRLIEMVKGIAERIGYGLGQRIFRHGLERATAFSRNLKMTRIFPTANEWANDGAYIFWLGTTLLEKQRKWILFQSK